MLHKLLQRVIATVLVLCMCFSLIPGIGAEKEAAAAALSAEVQSEAEGELPGVSLDAAGDDILTLGAYSFTENTSTGKVTVGNPVTEVKPGDTFLLQISLKLADTSYIKSYTLAIDCNADFFEPYTFEAVVEDEPVEAGPYITKASGWAGAANITTDNILKIAQAKSDGTKFTAGTDTAIGWYLLKVKSDLESTAFTFKMNGTDNVAEGSATSAAMDTGKYEIDYTQSSVTVSIKGKAPTLNKVTLTGYTALANAESDVTLQATAKSVMGTDITSIVTWSVSPAGKGVTVAADGKVTVDKKAKAGSYTITATPDGVNALGSAKNAAALTVARKASVGTAIRLQFNGAEFTGSTQTVTIPQSGAHKVYTYTAEVYDQYDELMPDEKATLSVTGGLASYFTFTTGTGVLSLPTTVVNHTTGTLCASYPNVSPVQISLTARTLYAKTIEISGGTTIAVPVYDFTGEKAGSAERTFTTAITDQFDQTFEPTVTWSLKTAVSGASIDQTGKLTIDNTVANGQKIIVVASADGETAPITDEIAITANREDAVATKIVMTGDNSIPVPVYDFTNEKAGSSDKTYTAKVYDQYNSEMTSAAVSWELKSPVTGASVKDGRLTVTSAAADKASIIVKATGGSASEEMTVTANREAAAVTNITITGSTEVYPESSTTYAACVRNQYGEEMPDKTVIWSLKNGVSALSMNSSTGELSFAENEDEEIHFSVVAACEGKTGELSVTAYSTPKIPAELTMETFSFTENRENGTVQPGAAKTKFEAGETLLVRFTVNAEENSYLTSYALSVVCDSSVFEAYSFTSKDSETVGPFVGALKNWTCSGSINTQTNRLTISGSGMEGTSLSANTERVVGYFLLKVKAQAQSQSLSLQTETTSSCLKGAKTMPGPKTRYDCTYESANVTIRALESITVSTEPDTMIYLEGKDTLDVTGGKITLYYDDASTEVVDLTADMVQGFDNTVAGQENLTVTYKGKQTTLEITIKAKSVISVAMVAEPEKLVYLEAKDALDCTGGKIKLSYDNDTAETVDLLDSMVTGFDNTQVGEQTLTVTCGQKETTFRVTIKAKTLLRIEVEKSPNKVEFYELLDSLDVTGGRLQLVYDNDTTETIPMTAEMISGYDNTEVGPEWLAVKYKGKTTGYTITILPKPVHASLHIIPYSFTEDKETGKIIPGTQKDKFMPGETVLAALSVTAEDDTYLQSFTLRINCSGTVFETYSFPSGEDTVGPFICNASGWAVSENFREEDNLISLAGANSAGTKLTAGMPQIIGYYLLKSKESAASQKTELSVAGNENVLDGATKENGLGGTYICDYSDVKASVNIHRLTGITIAAKPAKTTFLEAKDNLDCTGGKISLEFDDETTEDIPLQEDMVTGFDNTEVGPQTLTVTFKGKTTTFDITIKPKTLVSVAVTTAPTKLAYEKGEALNIQGGMLTRYYDNDTTEELPITLNMISGYNSEKLGKQAITVTESGKQTTFGVFVIESQAGKKEEEKIVPMTFDRVVQAQIYHVALYDKKGKMMRIAEVLAESGQAAVLITQKENAETASAKLFMLDGNNNPLAAALLKIQK